MRRAWLASLCLVGGCGSGPHPGTVIYSYGLCEVTHDSRALVAATVTAVGPPEEAKALNLASLDGPTAVLPSERFSALTLEVTAVPLGAAAVGAKPGATLGALVESGAMQRSIPVSVLEPDGGFASGYFFLIEDSGRWLVPTGGLFRREEAQPALLESPFAGPIAEPDFLAQVAADADGGCVSSAPDAG